MKMNLIYVNSSTYIDFAVENNDFKVGDHVKILKFKNIFTRNFVPNQSEEVRKQLKIV